MITKHFEKRCRERCGIPKDTVPNYFDSIVNNGLRLEDCISRPKFYNYLKNMCKSIREPIIYNRYMIIVQHKYNSDEYVAVTILHLPKEYYSTAYSLMKTKKGVEQ